MPEDKFDRFVEETTPGKIILGATSVLLLVVFCYGALKLAAIFLRWLIAF
jgi:hypothetical protein